MNKKIKWGFIINPVAGKGLALRYISKIRNRIKKFKMNAEFFHTVRKKHAQEIAAELASSGYTHIIAVGGDGTVNEVASGIIDRDVIFGVIPAGSGNDFVPLLGFPEHFGEKDWGILFTAKTIKMDVGICNGNYFLNGMGFGFDAQVAAENYKRSEEKGGTGSYVWHIIRNIFRYKEKPIRTYSNGSERVSSCFIKTIGIGRRFGGGYHLTAQAIANDGLFDVCTVDTLSVFQRLKLFPKVSEGRHINNEKVHYYQTDRIEIDTDEIVPYHLDGEVFFDKHFSVSLVPEKLKVIFNPHGNHYFKTTERFEKNFI